MRKRFLLLFGVLALLLAGAGLVAVWLRPSGPISWATCERIREGMTQAEVEALLGGPPGSYTSPDNDWSWVLHNGLVPEGHTVRVWVADAGGIRVYFDAEGRVADKQWTPSQQSFFDRLRRRLGL